VYICNNTGSKCNPTIAAFTTTTTALLTNFCSNLQRSRQADHSVYVGNIFYTRWKLQSMKFCRCWAGLALAWPWHWIFNWLLSNPCGTAENGLHSYACIHFSPLLYLSLNFSAHKANDLGVERNHRGRFLNRLQVGNFGASCQLCSFKLDLFSSFFNFFLKNGFLNQFQVEILHIPVWIYLIKSKKLLNRNSAELKMYMLSNLLKSVINS
jgi:hypothetical protein